MDIPMTDIKDLQDSVTELKTGAAVNSVLMKSMVKTQEDIVHILSKQAAQDEKNKIYDGAIEDIKTLSEKITDNRVKIATAIATTAIIVVAVMKIAFT